MTAWRYGSLRASASVMGLEIAELDISSSSFCLAPELVDMYKRAARIDVAEVSAPATL